MKKTRFFLIPTLILFFQFSQAQLIMIDSETGEYSYEEVIAVNGKSQGEILQLAKDWSSTYFQNQFNAVSDSTSINWVGTTPITWKLVNKPINIQVFFDAEIKTKEGKFKYKFSNFREGKVVRGEIDAHDLKTYIERFPQRYQIFAEEPVDKAIMDAVESLQYFVNHGTMPKEDDDW